MKYQRRQSRHSATGSTGTADSTDTQETPENEVSADAQCCLAEIDAVLEESEKEKGLREWDEIQRREHEKFDAAERLYGNEQLRAFQIATDEYVAEMCIWRATYAHIIPVSCCGRPIGR